MNHSYLEVGEYDDPQELADKVQADLQSGLDANK